MLLRLCLGISGCDMLMQHDVPATCDKIYHSIHCVFLILPHFAKYMCRGQNMNPGPTSHNLIRIAVVNPTAVHQKVGKIMKLNADIVALSETSATHAVQSQVNKDLVGCGFHAFWSATVSSKKFSSDNRPSLRGEALGSALFTHLPSRKPRSGFH